MSIEREDHPACAAEGIASISAGLLASHGRRVGDAAVLQACQPPRVALADEDQRSAEVPARGPAPEGRLRSLLADDDGGVAEQAHAEIVQAQGIVREVARTEACQPL